MVQMQIGTIVLWIFWPSFNGALASSSDGGASAQQFHCVLNTVLSLLGACIVTFMISAAQGKFNMVRPVPAADIEQSSGCTMIDMNVDHVAIQILWPICRTYTPSYDPDWSNRASVQPSTILSSHTTLCHAHLPVGPPLFSHVKHIRRLQRCEAYVHKTLWFSRAMCGEMKQ
jgi:hypothetical protein